LNAVLHDALESSIRTVLQSGRYVLGEQVAAFEEEFAAYCGIQHCVGVGNGTDALELALRALDLGPGDLVATVANAGMYATAAILAVGARPVYVDIDRDTMNMCPASLTASFSQQDGAMIRAVIVTHLYGQLAAMDKLLAVARGADVMVIEDCAQAHGAVRHGRSAGSFGHVGCFSFYPTKNLGALGDAGALITNDGAMAEKLLALRQYGWHSRFVSTPPIGRNSRLDEVQAAVLRCKLPYLAKWNDQRRAVIARYAHGLSDLDLNLPIMGGNDHAAHLCVARLNSRDQLQERLKHQDIASAIHYPLPDYRQPSVMAIIGESVELAETETSAASILTLPCFPDMTDDEIDAVITAIQKAMP